MKRGRNLNFDENLFLWPTTITTNMEIVCPKKQLRLELDSSRLVPSPLRKILPVPVRRRGSKSTLTWHKYEIYFGNKTFFN